MMGCWFRNGCVSVGVWPVGVFALRRPDTTVEPAAVMVGLGSVFDCVRWGFMNCARGSNPEPSSWEESRDGTGTGTGGGGTNVGLDWTTWGWIWGWGWGATGPAPLLRDWSCGLLVSLLVEVFFCSLGTSPGRQRYMEYKEEIRGKLICWRIKAAVSQNKIICQLFNLVCARYHSQSLRYQRSRCCLKMRILSSSLSHLSFPEASLLWQNTPTTFRNWQTDSFCHTCINTRYWASEKKKNNPGEKVLLGKFVDSSSDYTRGAAIHGQNQNHDIKALRNMLRLYLLKG